MARNQAVHWGRAMDILILKPGLFRLALALAVVVAHITDLDVGHLAVLLFFYLSGYWVTKIYQEKFGGSDVPRFYASRFLRIYPLFLIATLVAAGARGSDLHLANFTLFGISYGNDPTLVSWSLDYEAQFYLLVPILAPLMAIAPRRVLAGALVASAIGFGVNALYGMGFPKFCLPFILGGLTHTLDWRPSRQTALRSLVAFVGFTALTAFTPFLLKSTADPFTRDAWALPWMLPLLPYVAYSLRQRSSRFDRTLGDLSFPVYLFHQLVIFAVAQAGLHGGNAQKLAVLAGTAVVSLAIYYAIDRPLDRLRVAWTEGRRTAPAG